MSTPWSLLGYIAMFECYPTARQDVERVQAAAGHGPEAFRTLLLHADLDTQHGDDLDDLLDSLPLTEQQRTLMGLLSAMSSVQLISQAREELLDRFWSTRPAASGPCHGRARSRRNSPGMWTPGYAAIGAAA